MYIVYLVCIYGIHYIIMCIKYVVHMHGICDFYSRYNMKSIHDVYGVTVCIHNV